MCAGGQASTLVVREVGGGGGCMQAVSIWQRCGGEK